MTIRGYCTLFQADQLPREAPAAQRRQVERAFFAGFAVCLAECTTGRRRRAPELDRKAEIKAYFNQPFSVLLDGEEGAP